MSRDVLPDSRARDTKGVVQTKTVFGIMVPIYCANCGCEGGLVPEQNMTFAFWLCTLCFETYGHITGTMVQPDQEFWAQVRADQEGERQRAIEKGQLVLRVGGEGDQSEGQSADDNGIIHP